MTESSVYIRQVLDLKEVLPGTSKLFMRLTPLDMGLPKLTSFDIKKIQNLSETLLYRHFTLSRVYSSVNVETIWLDDNILRSLFITDSDPRILNVYIVKINEETSHLLFMFHHYSIDCISLDLIRNEITTLIKLDTLSEMTFTYEEYLKWEKVYKTSSIFNKSIKWWKELPFNIISLSSLYNPEEINTTQSKIFKISIDDPVYIRKWNDILIKYQCSSIFLIQCLMTFMMYKKTNNKLISLGGSYSNRPSLQSEKCIGMFVNTVLYTYHIEESKTFDQWIIDSKKEFFKLVSHSKVPYSYIYEKQPNIMITSMFYKYSPLEWNIPYYNSLYELHLDISFPNPSYMEWIWMYRVDKFNQSQMKSFIDELLYILNLIHLDPNNIIGSSIDLNSKTSLKT
jgi:hypothetical protein